MSGEEVCWSADSNWVLSGSIDGTIVAWDLTPPTGAAKLESVGRDRLAETLKPVTVLKAGDGQHAPSRAVAFNPRYGMMGVGGEELVSSTGKVALRLTDISHFGSQHKPLSQRKVGRVA